MLVCFCSSQREHRPEVRAGPYVSEERGLCARVWAGGKWCGPGVGQRVTGGWTGPGAARGAPVRRVLGREGPGALRWLWVSAPSSRLLKDEGRAKEREMLEVIQSARVGG